MICGACKTETPSKGLFTSHNSDAPAPLCFACVFVYCLKTATCPCGNDCIAFIAVQTQAGSVAPMALCPDCLTTATEEIDPLPVMPETDRTLVAVAKDC